MLADKGYFDLIHYKWLAGTSNSALTSPYHVVLTSDQAKLYFPNIPYEAMLGKTVMYNTIKTTVSGIVQTLTAATGFAFHDILSYSTGLANPDLRAQLRLSNWGSTSVKSQLFVKLSPATKVAQIETQLNAILAKNNPPTKGKLKILPYSHLAIFTSTPGMGALPGMTRLLIRLRLQFNGYSSVLVIIGLYKFY